MAVNCFDTKAVLDEVAIYVPISGKEVEEINKRLLMLATRAVPPVWGYAGMLLTKAKSHDIEDRCDIEVLICKWEIIPEVATKAFRAWNADRLAK